MSPQTLNFLFRSEKVNRVSEKRSIDAKLISCNEDLFVFPIRLTYSASLKN